MRSLEVNHALTFSGSPDLQTRARRPGPLHTRRAACDRPHSLQHIFTHLTGLAHATRSPPMRNRRPNRPGPSLHAHAYSATLHPMRSKGYRTHAYFADGFVSGASVRSTRPRGTGLPILPPNGSMHSPTCRRPPPPTPTTPQKEIYTIGSNTTAASSQPYHIAHIGNKRPKSARAAAETEASSCAGSATHGRRRHHDTRPRLATVGAPRGGAPRGGAPREGSPWTRRRRLGRAL